ncbi:MAG: VanZ family protein [Clostridiales bacterium]|nr:VanZ family protein [Clostridiales bacterium]
MSSSRRKPELKQHHRKLVHVAAVILFLLYLGVLAYILFFLEVRDGTYHNVNLVPFKTIRMLYTYYFKFHEFTSWYWIANIYGNIALLAPFGLLLPLVCHRRMAFWSILLLAALFSIAIEACQYLTLVGEADIDDVILNVFGALLGYIVYRILGNSFK